MAPAEPQPTVVPLPIRPRPFAGVSAGPVTEAAGPDTVVDVVMRRETATFRVPVSQATLPVTLFSTHGNLAEVLPEPRGDVASSPITAIARAIEPTSDDDEDLFYFNDLGEIDDADADGAANLAGRLRPAVPHS